MDQKSTWLWRKKSTEKMIVSSSDKVIAASKDNEDEMHTLLTDKSKLEKDLKSLNDKLSTSLSESNSKDDIIKKQVKLTEEALAGREKAEAKALSLKQELDEALLQRAGGEERLAQVEAALKECMQQLRFVRDEQENRIHDAVMKASGEFEKCKTVLEERLAQTSKSLATTGVENTHLNKTLLAKEKVIEDLTKQKAQLEADISSLLTRSESTEKDYASMKYEVRVLEKELEIRNEEREFNRRAADASHKQHLESVKKITRLESECQRLRLLVRKRLPGPAAVAKMKSEVDVLGRDSVEMRRRRTKSSPNGSIIDAAADISVDTLSKQISFLTEQLYASEEENKTLKENLNKQANELQTLRAMYARAASKLSQAESHFDELSKSQTILEPSRSGLPPDEFSLVSMSDADSEDKIRTAESWASALISELEHFKHGRQRESRSGKRVGGSDINLMDDFVEMEKLAVVSVDQQSGSRHVTSDDAKGLVSPTETGLNVHASPGSGREIIPLLESGSGVSDLEIKSTDAPSNKAPDWLQGILKVVLEKSRMPRRNPNGILEDVRLALADISNEIPAEGADTRESFANSSHITRYISGKPADNATLVDPSCAINDDDVTSADKNNQYFHLNLGKSIQKIIENVEGITSSNDAISNAFSRKDGILFPYKNESSSGYVVRVFQWKSSELNDVLRQFVHACNDLLNGKSDVNGFAEELSSTLEWIVNHCFSIQDVSSMRDAIKKHFEWDETHSESEAEVGLVSQLSEVDKLCLSHDGLPNGFGNNKFHSIDRDENMKDSERRTRLTIDKSETLKIQLQESEKTSVRLQAVPESLKMPSLIETQSENQELTGADLDAQLTVAKADLNEAQQKISSFEAEMENKNSCYQELEATCTKLQLQLDSTAKKACPNHEEENQLRTDLEITAASAKLAECQETILNLGKQLKALATPSEADLFNKRISASPSGINGDSASTDTTLSAPKQKLTNQRSSLLDQMLAEDNAKTTGTGSPRMKERENMNPASVSDEVIEPIEKILILNGTENRNDKGTENDNDNVAITSLAIVPRKKKGGGNLWRKLLWRRKKSNSKKPTLPFPS